jgi:hypothetical protein
MERSVSMVDHYEFISQDYCDRPVVTRGHVWSNKIHVWVDWEEGMPKPPSDRPKLQDAVVSAKLSAVSKTTKLAIARLSRRASTRCRRPLEYGWGAE